MNERARNRLVGSIILVSLAVLFLPMLFDGAGIEQRELPAMPAGPVHRAPAPMLDAEAPDWAFVDEVRVRRDDPERAGVDGRGRHEAAPASTSTGVAGAGAEDGETGSGEEERTPQEALPDTRLADDGTPLAWSVQLATFAAADNAEALRTRLLADGYEAYLNTVTAGDRVLHRVAVGPRLDRGAVDRLRGELAARYELEGVVVRFTLERSGAGQ